MSLLWLVAYTGTAVTSSTDEQRIALFKDNKLQLLISLIGFTRLGDPDDSDASWVIPSSLTASQLASSLEFIKKFEFDPPTYEDGKAAIDFIRSKAAGERARRPRAEYDDDSEDSGNEEFLFPAGGPTNQRSDALEELKKRRKVRRKRTEESDIDDEENDRKAEERRAKRREAELEKRRKIKSDLFVHDSDEEEDEDRDKEFFEKEEAVRKKTADAVAKVLLEVRKSAATRKKSKKRKQGKETGLRRKKRKTIDGDESEENQSDEELLGLETGSSRPSSVEAEDPMRIDSSDEDAGAQTDTPVSSQQPIPDPDEENTPVIDSLNKTGTTAVELGDEDEDLPVTKPIRRAVRAGFIIDSDSDE